MVILTMRRDPHGGQQGEIGILDPARRLHQGEIRLRRGLGGLGDLDDRADAMPVARFRSGLHGLGVLQRLRGRADAGTRRRIGVEGEADIVDHLLMRVR